MLKVGIVGCGKIADSHALQIQRIPGCQIVGVCDREPLMAEQLFERFPIGGCFTDISALLQDARPDVVHITTPPETHFDIARFCLENGVHVYIEKPFTVDAGQAARLIQVAVRKDVKLTVGHNDQFSHVARRMRELVGNGYLGGRPVHMESHYAYDLGDPSYARAMLGDNTHWVRRLPGKLLQNVMSHGIARIAEFLSGDTPQVFAHGFGSKLLQDLGETEIMDELRVTIIDEEGTTAYFTFSSQIKPALHEFRVFGPKNGLAMDQDHEVLLQLRGAKYKSYADKFIPPVAIAKQQVTSMFRNMRLFATADFHMDSGMKYLIQSFYRAIMDGEPLPISYREIMLTARIMDRIIQQIAAPTGNKMAVMQAGAVGALAG